MTSRDRKPLMRNYGRGNGEEAMERAAELLDKADSYGNEGWDQLAQAYATFALAAFTQELVLTAEAARNDGREI